jgi:YHS domain-containing protein/outer membrane murein-binding lipoprotein Lpp
MVRKVIMLSALLALAAVSTAVLVGCSESRKHAPASSDTTLSTQAATKKPDSEADAEHAHKPGEHGGIIVEIGRDNYHAEAVFEKGGLLRLYTLGKDEAKIQEVESQTLTGYVKPEGGTEATSFVFRPVPQPGDADGKTSQFVAKLPKELAGKRLEVTIPSIRIGGERFRLGFKSVSASHNEELLDKVSGEEEQQLYLTPGGKYTEADIKANGKITASQKFKGVMSSHEMKPKSGDKICPITRTKANPSFTWIVGGKTYEFCCPPCIDEFVKTAKEHPEEIKEPRSFIKK